LRLWTTSTDTSGLPGKSLLSIAVNGDRLPDSKPPLIIVGAAQTEEEEETEVWNEVDDADTTGKEEVMLIADN